VAGARATLPELISRETARRRRRHWVWAGVGVAVVVGIVLSVVLTRPRPTPMVARLRTAQVTRADLVREVREVRATGAVEAVSTVLEGAEISGRVATVEVDFNQHVVAGQVLARFDLTAPEAQRAQSSAMALSTRAQISQARSDLTQATRG
jgi:multidrug efflux pump subunit AcrA (membrane-fusion protein)